MNELSASDVADKFKTKRYWTLMDQVSDANAKGRHAREHQLLRSVQDELHKSKANELAGKMLHA